MNFRFVQQVRLWIYMAMLFLGVLGFPRFSDSGVEGVVFVLILILPFLEVCPECGHLSWHETGHWPNIIWISMKCKEDELKCHEGDESL